jgi:hypothetical protein
MVQCDVDSLMVLQALVYTACAKFYQQSSSCGLIWWYTLQSKCTIQTSSVYHVMLSTALFVLFVVRHAAASCYNCVQKQLHTYFRVLSDRWVHFFITIFQGVLCAWHSSLESVCSSYICSMNAADPLSKALQLMAHVSGSSNS